MSTPNEAKNFLLAQRYGLLSSISVSQNGYPFGSLAPYDIDERLNVFIYVSLIAEHYKNLLNDSRASLMVCQPFGTEDPQAQARATLLLDFNLVPQEQQAEVQQRYELRFPGSIKYELMHNFVFMQGSAVKLRWIGGFGDIKWIEVDKLRAAPSDPLAYHSHEMISHMNQDHVEALGELVRVHSSFKSDGFRLQMSAICATHLTITLQGQGEPREVKIEFPREIQDPREARSTIIKMLKNARSA